jgi:hypothetical protein
MQDMDKIIAVVFGDSKQSEVVPGTFRLLDGEHPLFPGETVYEYQTPVAMMGGKPWLPSDMRQGPVRTITQVRYSL